MKIPADSLLLEGKQVECDEADLTGEPDQKEKIVITEDESQYKWQGN
jgi:magnesium-transporting ATPase (P-type)